MLVRRAIIGPIWLPLGTALALVFLAAAAIASLAAPLSRRRRPARLALFAAMYLAIDVGLVRLLHGPLAALPPASGPGPGTLGESTPPAAKSDSDRAGDSLPAAARLHSSAAGAP